MIAYFKKFSAILEAKDVQLVTADELRGHGMDVVDLTAEEEEEANGAVENETLLCIKRNAPSKAYIVRHALTRLIAPTLSGWSLGNRASSIGGRNLEWTSF
jgi:hypothetical protein